MIKNLSSQYIKHTSCIPTRLIHLALRKEIQMGKTVITLYIRRGKGPKQDSTPVPLPLRHWRRGTIHSDTLVHKNTVSKCRGGVWIEITLHHENIRTERINSQQHRNVRKPTNVICLSCLPTPWDSYHFEHIRKYLLRDQRRDFEHPVFWIPVSSASYTGQFYKLTS